MFTKPFSKKNNVYILNDRVLRAELSLFGICFFRVTMKKRQNSSCGNCSAYTLYCFKNTYDIHTQWIVASRRIYESWSARSGIVS